jgi:Tat protein translocase TatB subunit
MFGLGMPEVLMILAIALIVIGPKKLPDLAKTLGRALGEFKRSAQDFKRSIDVETTVKDIDIPKTNLTDIIEDTQAKDDSDSNGSNSDDPGPDDSGPDDSGLDDSGLDDSGKEESENTIDEIPGNKDPEDKDIEDKKSDKTDSINPETNKTD